MRLDSIQFTDFVPFGRMILNFPSCEESARAEVQILVGENGTGKTRILSAIAAMGNDYEPLKTRTLPQSREFRIRAMIHDNDHSYLWSYDGRADRKVSRHNQLRHGAQEESWNAFQGLTGISTDVSKGFGLMVCGFRGGAKLMDTAAVPFNKIRRPDLVFNFGDDMRKYVTQTIVNWKFRAVMERQDNDDQAKSPATTIIESLEKALTVMTGKPVRFRLQSDFETPLTVKWGENEMLIRLLPDGLISLISLLCQCATAIFSAYPESSAPLLEPFIILLDEPETHLHPAWQRRLMPAIQEMFNRAQVIVATHSPFVVSSVNSGWIHILKWNDHDVRPSAPLPCSKGDSWLDAAEDYLGVKEWFDIETERLLARFRKERERVVAGHASYEELKALANELADRGPMLSEIVARELAQLRGRKFSGPEN